MFLIAPNGGWAQRLPPYLTHLESVLFVSFFSIILFHLLFTTVSYMFYEAREFTLFFGCNCTLISIQSRLRVYLSHVLINSIKILL